MVYDLAIIGGGPAGYMAAERAGEAGLSTLLVERNKLGGVCLNEGCIPTKALLSFSKSIRKEDGAVSPLLDLHMEAMTNKNKVVDILVRGVSATLKAKNVQVIYGDAVVVKVDNRFEVIVGQERCSARQVLLATGSEPVIPPIDGLREGMQNGFVMTSSEMLASNKIPGSLVIVGGGVIGIEMATYFRSMGSRITIVEALPAIGGNIEPDAAAFLQNMLQNKGTTIRTDAKVTAIADRSVTIETGQGAEHLDAEQVLLCIGRRPALRGLEKLGVLVENGAVKTDDRMRTNIAGVYAAGDINGKYMLAHVAYREAEVAVNNIIGINDVMDYRAVSGVIYTVPEVAYVGMSERDAKRQCADAAASKTSINMSGRHVAEQGLSDGFCKLVVDRDKDIIIGATIVGAYASEIIYSLGLIIQNKIPIKALKKTIFPHPTVSEIVRESIFSI